MEGATPAIAAAGLVGVAFVKAFRIHVQWRVMMMVSMAFAKFPSVRGELTSLGCAGIAGLAWHNSSRA